MVSLLITGLGVCSLLVAVVSSSFPVRPSSPPLAVIADSPYSVAKYDVNVPLVVVDSSALRMIRDAKIRAVSPTEPLVTCSSGNQYFTEATPAVRVVLRRPMYIRPDQNLVPFPAALSVVYGGLRMGLPVGAVIAPVPHQGFDRPHIVRVVYAVPSGPLPLQYPYYDPFAYSSPFYSEAQVLPVSPFQPSFNPSPFYSSFPQQQQEDQSNAVVVAEAKRPGKPSPPQVTVLDFPTAVATPEVLYYQPPLDDSELGNRGPPEAIAPAGIVQSTQPVASLESFLNSKESPVLNALREQAEKNKDKEDESNEGVLAL